MLFSVPFFYGFTILALEPLYVMYILAFIGLWFINLNWALVGDILLVTFLLFNDFTNALTNHNL